MDQEKKLNQFHRIMYLGLEVNGKTYFIDLQNMVVEERLEKDGHWEVIPDAKFNWCEEGALIFDEDHHLIERN